MLSIFELYSCKLYPKLYPALWFHGLQSGKKVDIQPLLLDLGKYYSHTETLNFNPVMLEAVRCLRAEGIKTALLTNNFEFMGLRHLPANSGLFDVVS